MTQQPEDHRAPRSGAGAPRVLAGIFVGGRGTRMGGVAKGLLAAPDGPPIVVRTRRLLEAAGARCVLVGAWKEEGRDAYADLGLETIDDDPRAEGPMAGLLALLERAGDGHALAVACDMPWIAPAALHRLIAAPPAPIVAPRTTRGARSDVWEPLFARYDARAVRPTARALAARGVSRLQVLMEEAGAVPLVLSGDHEARSLVDWDTPEDMRALTRAPRLRRKEK